MEMAKMKRDLMLLHNNVSIWAHLLAKQEDLKNVQLHLVQKFVQRDQLDIKLLVTALVIIIVIIGIKLIFFRAVQVQNLIRLHNFVFQKVLFNVIMAVHQFLQHQVLLQSAQKFVLLDQVENNLHVTARVIMTVILLIQILLFHAVQVQNLINMVKYVFGKILLTVNVKTFVIQTVEIFNL